MKSYSIEHIEALIEELNEFNSHNLKDIELTKNGLPFIISEKALDNWRFVGLSNKCFIEMEGWQEDFLDDNGNIN